MPAVSVLNRNSPRTSTASIHERPWITTTTAQSVGELLQPHRTTLHAENRYNKDWPLSGDATVGPAILLNKVGKGTVLTFAGSPDWATASDHHITETRRLLASAVRL